MTDSLLESFVSEARELLHSSASALLVLEKQGSDEAAINDVFRSVHTLKGSVGLFDFPAFIKLVHAGEDVLSAVRGGDLKLSSAMVDLLLDALDQVGIWVDEIASNGNLSAGADGVSKDLTARLRHILPADHHVAQTGRAAAYGVDLIALDWLEALPAADRLTAFVEAMDGGEILAVEYVPGQDCFFSGEDPFILFRQLAGLRSIAIEPTEPFGTLDSYEPYRCVLRFRALVAAPRAEVEGLFRYVVEQVRLASVPPHALISVTGDITDGSVDMGFVKAARELIACAGWPALRRLVDARLQTAQSAPLLASALRGLEAVLTVAFPDPAWVTALVECIEKGEADPHPLPYPPASLASVAVDPAPAFTAADRRTGVGAVTAPSPVSPMALRILASQRVVLRLPMPVGRLAASLDSIARTVDNLLTAEHRRGTDAAEWSAAVEAAKIQDNAAPVLDLLDRWLGVGEVDNLVSAATPASDDRSLQAAPYPTGKETKHASRILKVDQGKIDALMNLIGELLISKNSLPFMARRAEQVHGSREMSREIKDLHAVIDRLAQEMQGAIMAVRMLPVSDVFDRFPRLVRDVSRKLGKQIDLVIEGADTAADKNIIEALSDPLLHVVRNAIDHGIEAPEDRDDLGKPARATVLLRAFQESDQVIIEVIDDGRGIDPEMIKQSAMSKGIIDDERAARLTDQEAVNLVFTAGFSTVSQVSDLSGRGVGMDVVVNGVEKAGGSVSITSVKDMGTTVRLSLPLSMAVTRVMVVEACGGMLFGIQMDQIAATVRVHRHEVRHLKQSTAFVLRDAIVPLVRLDRLLDIKPATRSGDGNEDDAVLVVRSGGSLVGLVVDHFHEGMDIILKPFEGILASIRGFSGSALLGDGRVLLVLNLKEHL